MAASFLYLGFRISTLMACCTQAFGGCNSRLGCAVLEMWASGFKFLRLRRCMRTFARAKVLAGKSLKTLRCMKLLGEQGSMARTRGWILLAPTGAEEGAGE